MSQTQQDLLTEILNTGEGVTTIENMTQDIYDHLSILMQQFNHNNLGLTTKQKAAEYMRILNLMVAYEINTNRNKNNRVVGGYRRRASKRSNKCKCMKSRARKTKSRRH